MKTLHTIAYIVMLALIVFLAYKYFTLSNRSTQLTAIEKQQASDIVINDSIKGVEQSILQTSDIKAIRFLQDSLQRLFNEKARVDPEILLKYKETFSQKNQLGEIRDSLFLVIDDLIAKSKDNTISIDSFLAYKNKIINSKIPFKIKNQWLAQGGTIDFKGNIVSDSIIVISEPLITIGEKKALLKQPVYTVTVGNKNPYITTSSLSSVMYKPKKSTEFSVGPMAMFDGKSIVGGAGINLKRGIFSVSLGYQFINTKK